MALTATCDGVPVVEASAVLDAAFDRIGRLRDGEINYNSLGMTDFRWACRILMTWYGIQRDSAERIARLVGWY
jgi:hypothetical protein